MTKITADLSKFNDAEFRRNAHRAAIAHKEANKSDPFAYDRIMNDFRHDHAVPSEVEKRALAIIEDRKNRIEAEFEARRLNG